jgi:hypothetical protein
MDHPGHLVDDCVDCDFTLSTKLHLEAIELAARARALIPLDNPSLAVEVHNLFELAFRKEMEAVRRTKKSRWCPILMYEAALLADGAGLVDERDKLLKAVERTLPCGI